MYACTFMKHARAHLHSLMRTEKFACLAPACHVASCHAPGGQVATGIVFNRLLPTIQQVRPGSKPPREFLAKVAAKVACVRACACYKAARTAN